MNRIQPRALVLDLFRLPAVVGLDLVVDRREELRVADAVLDPGRLVDRQQEHRHPELADHEVRHARARSTGPGARRRSRGSRGWGSRRGCGCRLAAFLRLPFRPLRSSAPPSISALAFDFALPLDFFFSPRRLVAGGGLLRCRRAPAPCRRRAWARPGRWAAGAGAAWCAWARRAARRGRRHRDVDARHLDLAQERRRHAGS